MARKSRSSSIGSEYVNDAGEILERAITAQDVEEDNFDLAIHAAVLAAKEKPGQRIGVKRGKTAGNRPKRPNLTVEQILIWADLHYERTGKWPVNASGALVDAPGETWNNISDALRNGHRGLVRGGSLGKLLAQFRGKFSTLHSPPLSIDVILGWADAYHTETGKWPNCLSGPVDGQPNETWHSVDVSLKLGARGLTGYISLARLLHEQRSAANRAGNCKITVDQILAWAGSHYERTGKWPTQNSGEVAELPGRTWHMLHGNLGSSYHGLPRGMGLTKLLAERRGVYHKNGRPQLTVEMILGLADAYFQKTGRWPKSNSGGIEGQQYDTWSCVDKALRGGCRGLPGGSSLARLLYETRAVPHDKMKEKLTEARILSEADAWYSRTGQWPNADDGPVSDGSKLTWGAVDSALFNGLRGLPGKSSLYKLLVRNRDVYSHRVRRPLTIAQILEWADRWFAHCGRWPNQTSGHVPGEPHEKWPNIDMALKGGTRGLAPGNSLAQLLQQERGVRNRLKAPNLSIDTILEWCDNHFMRAGRWPTVTSGDVLGQPGETWVALNASLRHGRRGLPEGTTLFRLLAERRGVPDRRPPELQRAAKR